LALTRAEKAAARELFEAGGACEHCGALHKRACPRVRRLVVARTGPGDGRWTEAEYWPEYDQTGIVWPEDAYDPSDGEGAAGG
jgi:hypothetical protein